jgi:hypothetical protein
LRFDSDEFVSAAKFAAIGVEHIKCSEGKKHVSLPVSIAATE